MTELEQAATDLAKAFLKLHKGGFINSYEPEYQHECDHYCFIAHQAVQTIAALVKDTA